MCSTGGAGLLNRISDGACLVAAVLLSLLVYVSVQRSLKANSLSAVPRLPVRSLAFFAAVHSIAALAASTPLTALHALCACAGEEFSGLVVDGGGSDSLS